MLFISFATLVEKQVKGNIKLLGKQYVVKKVEVLFYISPVGLNLSIRSLLKTVLLPIRHFTSQLLNKLKRKLAQGMLLRICVLICLPKTYIYSSSFFFCLKQRK